MNKMMNGKWLRCLLLLAVLTFTGGCSSDGDSGSDSPASSLLTQGTDVRPDWKYPSVSDYEQTMGVQFRLQDELAAYVTEQDLMCAMISGEVRALCEPEISDDGIYFPLVIFSDDSDVRVSISYYCDRLHRIYTLSNWHDFDATLSPLNAAGEPYLLNFIPQE